MIFFKVRQAEKQGKAIRKEKGTRREFSYVADINEARRSEYVKEVLYSSLTRHLLIIISQFLATLVASSTLHPYESVTRQIFEIA